MLSYKAVSIGFSSLQGLCGTAIAMIGEFPRIDFVLTLKADSPPSRAGVIDAIDAGHGTVAFFGRFATLFYTGCRVHDASVAQGWGIDHSPEGWRSRPPPVRPACRSAACAVRLEHEKTNDLTTHSRPSGHPLRSAAACPR